MDEMTLEEALAASTDDGVLVTPVNDVLLVDPETRLISVPASEENFGTYKENDVARKYFKCPRIVQDNMDLSTCEIFINYESASGKPGQYKCDDVELTNDGNHIAFSWLLSRNVFDKNKDSTIYFSVQAKKIGGGNVFNTRKAQGKMYETIDATEEIEKGYADVVMQLIEEVKKLRDDVGMLDELVGDGL